VLHLFASHCKFLRDAGRVRVLRGLPFESSGDGSATDGGWRVLKNPHMLELLRRSSASTVHHFVLRASRELTDFEEFILIIASL